MQISHTLGTFVYLYILTFTNSDHYYAYFRGGYCEGQMPLGDIVDPLRPPSHTLPPDWLLYFYQTEFYVKQYSDMCTPRVSSNLLTINFPEVFTPAIICTSLVSYMTQRLLLISLDERKHMGTRIRFCLLCC